MWPWQAAAAVWGPYGAGPRHHPGLDQTWFVVSALAGPVAVAGLSTIELIRLRHLGVQLSRA